MTTDTRIVKAKNNESGTLTAQLSAVEVTTAHLDAVPAYTPGIIVFEAGTSKEEHVFFRKSDAGAVTISDLVRDISNLNGGSGLLHDNGAAWETMQASEYINNLVDALQTGWQQEPQTVAYASATTFTVQGNQTAIYTNGRFVRYAGDDAKIGIVVSSSYNSGTGVTTVTVTGFSVPNPTTQVDVLGVQAKGFSSAMPVLFGLESGTTNTFVLTVKPSFGAYFLGMIVAFKATTTNTGAATLNVNGIGAIAIKKNVSTALVAGDITTGQEVFCVYDGTNFQLINPLLPTVVVGTTDTQTLTNKRRTRRVVTVTQSATPTINTDNADIASITGLAQAITSMTTNLTGTPVAGDLLEVQITDNGTARAITWGASFVSTTVTLPTTTVISTLLRVLLEWNGSAWACVATA